ncbi:hypothetical protein NUITMVA1_31580 [Aeromonas hydrophila]|nr:hypothetical protein NUITMVA1_31580 [Aeromonas hydrophila]
MMAALKVMTYFKVSLSTHNWDRAIKNGPPEGGPNAHYGVKPCDRAVTARSAWADAGAQADWVARVAAFSLRWIRRTGSPKWQLSAPA